MLMDALNRFGSRVSTSYFELLVLQIKSASNLDFKKYADFRLLLLLQEQNLC